VERRHTVLVGQIGVCLVLDAEKLDEVDVVLADGPMERRESVLAVGNVDGRVEIDQQLADGLVSSRCSPVESRVSKPPPKKKFKNEKIISTVYLAMS